MPHYDRQFSRWPEAIPLKEITADTVAKAFHDNWVACYGTPAIITTDQGRQFESAIFQALTKYLGTNKTRTSPYHPASNGLVERWHRSLKTAITCKEHSHRWVDLLPDVLLGLRTCYKEDLKCSTAELVYGTPLRLPGEFFENGTFTQEPDIFVQELRNRMRLIRPQPTAHYGKRTSFMHRQLMESSHVFVRDDTVKRPLQPAYSGPHEMITKIDDRVFTVRINGRDVNISTERLKPAHLPPDGSPLPTTEDITRRTRSLR